MVGCGVGEFVQNGAWRGSGFAGDGAKKVGQVWTGGCVQVGWGVGSGLVAETTVGSGFVGRRW